MSRKGLLAVVVAVLAVVSATLVWSAEQAPAPAAPPAPAPAAQPAGEQPKAEAAPAPAAPAEGAPAPAAPTGAEAPAAPEKVKGLLLACKWSEGTPAMKDATLKVVGNKMQVEGLVGAGGAAVFLMDAGARAKYLIWVRDVEATPTDKAYREVSVDKYSWPTIDRIWRSMVDEFIRSERSRELEDFPKEREASEALVKAVEASKSPAALEVTEEKKKFGDYECVKYNLTQGQKTKGIVWVTKDVKLEAPVWTMLSYVMEPGAAGGLPVLKQLDAMEGVTAMRLNLEYVVFDGQLNDRKLNFWIEKVTEAEFDAAGFKIPSGARVSDALRGRE